MTSELSYRTMRRSNDRFEWFVEERQFNADGDKTHTILWETGVERSRAKAGQTARRYLAKVEAHLESII